MKHLPAIIIFLVALPVAADDNLIAYRLFEDGRYAESAEIFTDPAWKGIALYNSGQWWRAAEAFIRSDDYKSMYNLGNTYVKMSYYALALEAYQDALRVKPDFEDAQVNAQIMRELLKLERQGQGQSDLPRRGEEIDRLESKGEEEPDNNPGGGSDELNKDKEKGQDREGDTDDRGPSPEAGAAGETSEAGSDQSRQDDGSPEGGKTTGTESDSTGEPNPSTGAESENAATEAEAASLRAKLEAQQANEQWLNQINHDEKKYLRRKIELELARRKAAGQSAAEGGNLW